MKAISASKMREIDSKASTMYGISSLILMENAGREIALAAESKGARNIVVFCGSGNNAGDGFVAARYLFNKGYKVALVLVKAPSSLKNEALANYNITQSLKIETRNFDKTIELNHFDIIIDGLLGTGITGEVTGNIRDAIEYINSSKKTVISIDIPSGVNADTGEILGIAVKADTTVTMAVAKTGLLSDSAKNYVGYLEIADIGIPKELIDNA
ncbi:NAD(P)H-hydrate epimerase [Elusimicrobiota bacterium]